jgi:aromatic-L-amino-acid decarboxylase
MTEYAEQAGQAMARAMDYLEGVDAGRVWTPAPDADRDWLTKQPLPDAPRPVAELLDDISRHVLTYPMGNGHRRFFGWVNSPPSPAGVLVEPLAAALNASCAGGEHAGALLERTVVRWLAELVGYPVVPGGGLLTSGASMATIIAIAAARSDAASRRGNDVRTDGLSGQPPFVLYASEEAHSCVTKAAELTGIGSGWVRRIPVDAELRMNVASLTEAIHSDAVAGRVPCCIVANAGTVNTGAIDDIDAIASVAADSQIWLHVDGAYGALAAADPARRPLFAGIDRADSVAIDAHKWLGVPVDCGALLFRQPARVRDTFSLVPAYLRDANADDLGWFSEYGIEQTRPFRALRAWATIAHLGRDGVRDLIRRTCDIANRFADLVREHDDMELLTPVQTSIVAFRFTPAAASDNLVDDLNSALPHAVQLRGNVFLTGTTLNGRPVLRACFLNPKTTDEDLHLLLSEIRQAAQLE